MIQRRKHKKVKKYRGSRTHGGGNVKNRRGTGSKGGWGRAGMHKHRFSLATTYDREWMARGGRFGFHNPTRKDVPTINLYEIDNMIKNKEITASKFEFEGKILGTGQLSKPLEIVAWAATEKAIARVKAAGGKIVLPEASEEAPAPEPKPSKKA